jgi:hypothetical protein
MLLAALVAMPLALPAAAQTEGEDGLMERGLRLFMEGLMQEMEPAIRDLEGLAEEAGPLMRELQDRLQGLGDLRGYAAPEILPNGDIIIRRDPPLPEDLPIGPQGEIEL